MKYVVRITGAVFLAFLLGIVGTLIAEQGKGGDLFGFFFLVALVVYSILLLTVVKRVGFWFSLFFAIEWALLPVAAAINSGQERGVGCAGVAGAIGAGILLALTIPIGAAGFLVFLALAFFKFRKQNQEGGNQRRG
jgi:uncharacterized membrane protein